MNGFDIAWATGVVTERFAECGDGMSQSVLRHRLHPPHLIDELLSRVHLLGMSGEEHKQVDTPGLETLNPIPAGNPAQARLDNPLAQEKVAKRGKLKISHRSRPVIDGRI